VSQIKTALLTGITGQDGSYLAELLINKGYIVHGLIRRSSLSNTSRINHLIDSNKDLHLHYGDLTDSLSIMRIIDELKPDEIYNLGAQSHVGISFDQAEYTAETDALGPLRILEAVRILGLIEKTKIYQASTSELYGLVQESPQSEKTPFYPRSPYGVAKLYAYWITINYREAYGMYACNGILFNHESPRRGEEFVTRKITKALTRIDEGIQDCLSLGNLEALRDWGHAKDFVEMQWLMLQQEKAEDYVISTGEMTSVRKFVELSAKKLNWGDILWEGNGVDEIGRRKDNGQVVIKVDPKFYRPSEVENLLGDSSKAHKKLGWKPTFNLAELVSEMIENDKRIASQEKHLLQR
tara:strand:- start:1816 stop:2874 length:1059 start_codon:yes stop_codon:yes gene_type:complete